jgi:hypothetical protein
MLPSFRLGLRIDNEGEGWLNASQKICSEGVTEPWDLVEVVYIALKGTVGPQRS